MAVGGDRGGHSVHDAAYAHGLLTRVVHWIERTRLDVDLVDYQIEML